MRGPAALSLAAAGSLLGISVVLVGAASRASETADMAAALRASADRAHAVRTGFLMGVGRPGEQPEIDEKAVWAHLRRVADRRKSSDSPVRYRAMGVQVIDGGGHFVDPHTFVSGAHVIKARRFVVATPSRPLIPDIPGLETVPYATAETILSLPAIPRTPFGSWRRAGGFVGRAGLSSSRCPGDAFCPRRRAAARRRSRDDCYRAEMPAPGRRSISSWDPRSSP